MTPVRIQLKRTKGWKMPPNTVKVTRPGIWGNPFVVVPNYKPGRNIGGNYIAVQTAQDAVECFREMMGLDTEIGTRAYLLRSRIDELRGKNLACWCPLPAPGEPDLCHAAVLLELSNRPKSTEGERP